MQRTALVMGCVLTSVLANASVPRFLNFSGNLTTSAGEPVEDGTHGLGVAFYDEVEDGEALLSDSYEVETQDGRFSVEIDIDDVTLIFGASGLWLEIAVEDETLSPRFPIASVPYALASALAEQALDLACDGCVDDSVIDPAAIQRRVLGICDANEAMVGVNVDGSVTCASVVSTIDYSAFGSCEGGQKMVGISETGAVLCADDIDTDTDTDTDTDALASLECDDEAVPEWDNTLGTWICGIDNMAEPGGVDFAVFGSCSGTQKVVGIRSDDGAVICVEEDGDITRVDPGIGLSGGGATGDVTLSADTSYLATLGTTQTITAAKTFSDNTLVLRNAGDTFSTTMKAPDATAARTITIPDVTGTVVVFGSCSTDQLLKWDGATNAWACADDVDTNTNPDADITAVNTSTGLSGGGATGELTLSVDTAYVATVGTAQTVSGAKTFANNTLLLRNSGDTLSTTVKAPDATAARTITIPDVTGTVVVAGSCSADQLLKWSGGAWICAADVDTTTTYTAGDGLALSGTAFRVIDGGINTARLADNAVSSAKILDGTIAAADIGGSVIDSSHVSDNTLTGTDILNGSIASDDILDGTLTSSDIADNIVASVDILDGTIATADIAASAVTNAIISDGTITFADMGQNSCATGQITKWNGAAWTCGTDVDATVQPTQIPRTNTPATVDSTGDVGMYSSITIGTDGFPVISYYDGGTTANLKVAKCGNAHCSSGNTLSTVDSTNIVGWHTSITIGADGFPVVSYYDYTNTALKVAKCSNPSCSSFGTPATVDNTWDVGEHSSITIGTDGYPVVSYYDATNRNLKLAKCNDAPCSSVVPPTLSIVDSTDDVGEHSSITIGTDGFPVVSYYKSTSLDLKVAKCGDASCSIGNTLSTVDSTNFVGQYTSITIGTDGFPVISYYDYTSSALKVAKCNDASCSSVAPPTLSTVDNTASVGQYTSITIGTDGFPVVSYYDGGATTANLKVAKCGNASCSSGNTLLTVDSTGEVGEFSSITIGADGFYVVSYYDSTNSALKVAKCPNIYCLNYWTRR